MIFFLSCLWSQIFNSPRIVGTVSLVFELICYATWSSRNLLCNETRNKEQVLWDDQLAANGKKPDRYFSRVWKTILRDLFACCLRGHQHTSTTSCQWVELQLWHKSLTSQLYKKPLHCFQFSRLTLYKGLYKSRLRNVSQRAKASLSQLTHVLLFIYIYVLLLAFRRWEF